MAALVEARRQAAAEFHRTLFGQLAEAERKADGLIATMSPRASRKSMRNI